MKYLIIVSLIFLVSLSSFFEWKVTKNGRRIFVTFFSRLTVVLILCSVFFPREKNLHTSVDLIDKKKLQIFVDDSDSMHNSGNLKAAEKMLKEVQTACEQANCSLHKTYLSEVFPKIVKEGYTPLISGITSWTQSQPQEPFLVLSDGGDSQGEMNLLTANNRSDGLIVGFLNRDLIDLSIDQVRTDQYLFESQSFNIHIELSYSKRDKDPIMAQVLVKADQDTFLVSQNVKLDKEEGQISLDVLAKGLGRGHHLITAEVLPLPNEANITNNFKTQSVEVLSNTLGVLHLLGSPSWDGRFLRRFLKAEPKFDVISFFILRDPWDDQLHAGEREFSLIPFPVERLFKEELPHFRVIVLQDFTVSQFLNPEYQRALVKFVEDGGGLLFLGGSRALTGMDLARSPLKQILPFETGENDFEAMFGEVSGIPYDNKYEYNLKFAPLSDEERLLVPIYDEWKQLLSKDWENIEWKGLHHREKLKFDPKKSVTLMTADSGAQSFPYAVASFAGKGRVLWLLSDNFYQFAHGFNSNSSFYLYGQMLESAFSWLVRRDLIKPLSISRANVFVNQTDKSLMHWGVFLSGAITKYIAAHPEDWDLSVCGQKLDLMNLKMHFEGEQLLNISGETSLLSMTPSKREICSISIASRSQRFGEVKDEFKTIIKKEVKDSENPQSAVILKALAKSLNSTLLFSDDSSFRDKLNEWVYQKFQFRTQNASQVKQKIEQDPYWLIYSAWAWLIVVCLAAEVLVRRWL